MAQIPGGKKGTFPLLSESSFELVTVKHLYNGIAWNHNVPVKKKMKQKLKYQESICVMRKIIFK